MDVLVALPVTLKILCYREGTAATIRGAIEEAKKGNLEPYLALTDSIIGTIKCADLRSVESNLDKNALKEVLISHNYTQNI